MKTVQNLAKSGQIVEFIHEAHAIEKLQYCDIEAVDEATKRFPRGTTGTVLGINIHGNEYLLMIGDCTYFVNARDTQVVVSYETSIQREFDQMESAFKELEDENP